MSIPFDGKDPSINHPTIRTTCQSKAFWLDLRPGEARWNKALTNSEVRDLAVGANPRTIATDDLLVYRPSKSDPDQSWYIRVAPL